VRLKDVCVQPEPKDGQVRLKMQLAFERWSPTLLQAWVRLIDSEGNVQTGQMDVAVEEDSGAVEIHVTNDRAAAWQGCKRWSLQRGMGACYNAGKMTYRLRRWRLHVCASVVAITPGAQREVALASELRQQDTCLHRIVTHFVP